MMTVQNEFVQMIFPASASSVPLQSIAGLMKFVTCERDLISSKQTNKRFKKCAIESPSFFCTVQRSFEGNLCKFQK